MAKAKTEQTDKTERKESATSKTKQQKPEPEEERTKINEFGEYEFISGPRKGQVLKRNEKAREAARSGAMVKVEPPQTALVVAEKMEQIVVYKNLLSSDESSAVVAMRKLTESWDMREMVLAGLENPEKRLVTLSAFKRTDSDMFYSLVTLMLIDAVEFFNVGKNMSAGQIEVTIDLIYEDYSHLSIEDMHICFREAKKGKYGKMYDRLDSAIVMEWLRQYDTDRTDIIVGARQNLHSQYKSDLIDGKRINERYDETKKKHSMAHTQSMIHKAKQTKKDGHS